MASTLSRQVFRACVIVLLAFGADAAALVDAAHASIHTKDTSTNAEVYKSLRGSRVLGGSTITTPNCSASRDEPYPAELQLFYTYSVDINKDLLLHDMERAIDNAVAIELDMCDVQGRPVYKVRTDTTHSFSTSGKCRNLRLCQARIYRHLLSIFLNRSFPANSFPISFDRKMRPYRRW